MAQFDVYLNPQQKPNPKIPYLLDVQADLLHRLNTRVVVPLILEAKVEKSEGRLTPVFEVEEKLLMMSTTELATLPLKILKKKVASLRDYRNEIIAAIDFLFLGF